MTDQLEKLTKQWRRIDFLRRESALFRRMTVAYQAAAKAQEAILQIARDYLEGPLKVPRKEIDDIVASLKADSVSPWGRDDLVRLIAADMVPILSRRFDNKESDRRQNKKDSASSDPTAIKAKRFDRTVSLGFISVKPAVATLFVGQSDMVRKALDFIEKEHTGTGKSLSFHRSQSDTEEVWRREEQSVLLFSPQWHPLLYSPHALKMTAASLEKEVGDVFDVILVDDAGVTSPKVKRGVSRTRYFSRVEEVCRRISSWAKHRGTAAVLGVHLNPGDPYRQIELARLHAVGSVYHLHQDGGYLWAQDAQGHDHEVGDA